MANQVLQLEREIKIKYNPPSSKKVQLVGDGSIICRFDKTPPPIKPTDVICPHFLELKWANGCDFRCAWCYLQGTYRFTGMAPRIKDYIKIESHTRAFLTNGSQPEVLNTGELADSLLSENTKQPFSKFIIPMFEAQNKHRVLLLTKSPNVKNLLGFEETPMQAIVSFSLNAEAVSKKWEKAPTVKSRIEAARKVSEKGYETRVRIDPMVPIENWQKHYFELIDQIFASFRPARITIGSLRGLQSTINNAADKSWTVYLSESSNWGKKIDFKLRYQMYSTVLKYLESKYGYKNVALCKETKEMWEKLNFDFQKVRCNCIL